LNHCTTRPGQCSGILFILFVMYREGLSFNYLIIGFLAISLFITTLMFGTPWVIAGMALLLTLFYFFNKRYKKRVPFFSLIAILLVSALFSFSVQYIFDNVFEQRHRDRFTLWLRLEDNPE